jgi:hypothetical protein
MTVPAPTRTALLDLHRALVEGERRSHEKAHGRMSGGDFLQALIRDPAFAWLAPLTGLIARLDEIEYVEAEGAQSEDHASVLAAIRTLLSLQAQGSEFQRRYAERIDTDPDLAVAHGIVMAELRRAMDQGPALARKSALPASGPLASSSCSRC